MSLPKKAAALRPPLFSFGQTENIKTVSSISDKFSEILQTNDKAIDELCLVADQLVVDKKQLDDFDDRNLRRIGTAVDGMAQNNSETVDQTDQDKLDNSKAEAIEDELRDQIEQLRTTIRRQKLRTQINRQLLDLSMLSMDKCVGGLREIYCQRAQDALALHKHYADLIEEKRNEYSKLLNSHNELESEFFTLVRNLGKVVSKSVDYKNAQQTADYADAKQYVLNSLQK